MDKEWTKQPRFSCEYKKGVLSFLDFAYTKGKPEGNEIICPCANCGNIYYEERDVVYDHLVAFGFVEGYKVWTNHGEQRSKAAKIDNRVDAEDKSHDDIDVLLFDTFRNVVETNGDNEGPNEDAKKFYNLIDESKQSLYPRCTNFSTLSFIIRMYLLKCLHGWSNALFSSLLELLKEAMPDLKIPDSFHKTKSMIKDLGLDYEKIDACPNDCMLYWGEYKCVQRKKTDQTSLKQRCSSKPTQVEKEKKWIKIPRMLLLNFMILFKNQMNVLGKLSNQYLAKKSLVECVAREER